MGTPNVTEVKKVHTFDIVYKWKFYQFPYSWEILTRRGQVKIIVVLEETTKSENLGICKDRCSSVSSKICSSSPGVYKERCNSLSNKRFCWKWFPSSIFENCFKNTKVCSYYFSIHSNQSFKAEIYSTYLSWICTWEYNSLISSSHA